MRWYNGVLYIGCDRSSFIVFGLYLVTRLSMIKIVFSLRETDINILNYEDFHVKIYKFHDNDVSSVNILHAVSKQALFTKWNEIVWHLQNTTKHNKNKTFQIIPLRSTVSNYFNRTRCYHLKFNGNHQRQCTAVHVHAD